MRQFLKYTKSGVFPLYIELAERVQYHSIQNAEGNFVGRVIIGEHSIDLCEETGEEAATARILAFDALLSSKMEEGGITIIIDDSDY